MTGKAQTVTILFTDLVNSTELLQRAGDDLAQRIFTTHHRLLSEAVAAHGGHEVKWLGDGLMVAFDSARDAVRCAVAMQQASRRPAVGERLEIRAGINVGDALRDETDYFGSSVVIARRLCDKAQAGQIIASDLVARLLDGRQDHTFDDLGFFVREVLLHLVDEGKVVREDGRWVSSVSVAEMGIPEGAREVIRRRLARLSPACNRMLTAASAMTGGVTWTELRAIAPDPEAVLLDALDEALAAQVVRETAPSTYDFAHALIRTHAVRDAQLAAPRAAAPPDRRGARPTRRARHRQTRGRAGTPLLPRRGGRRRRCRDRLRRPCRRCRPRGARL